MGHIAANFFISLDGVVEAPDQWHFDYFNDEMGALISEATVETKAFLMGRVLYNEWAAYWPNQTGDDDEFSLFINHVPKYVVSSTLEHAGWNNTTVVNGDIAARVREIKDTTDGMIGMSGSATTVRWLMANGLLDELRLLVHPVVVGHGQRLFEGGATDKFELKQSRALSSGVLYVTYAPAAT